VAEKNTVEKKYFGADYFYGLQKESGCPAIREKPGNYTFWTSGKIQEIRLNILGFSRKKMIN